MGALKLPENLIASRIRKVAEKSAWTVMSRLHSADIKNITTLHSRDVGQGPNELEFVKKYSGPAFIEPSNGYVISKDGYLIEESLDPNYGVIKPTWKIVTASPIDFVKASRDEDRITRVPAVISLRHLWEWNFYHFYGDVLAKINLFDEAGIDPSTPLLIGKYYDDVPFVKQIIHREGLGKREWIIQRDKYVLADEVYYCRTKQGRVKKLDTIAALMGAPVPQTAEGRRIFMTRPASGPRHVINNEEVEELTAKYNYESIDFGAISIDEQVKILNGTRHLIAIHGAGMVNMIFRRQAPLTIIALDSPIYGTADFPEIAAEFGYYYRSLKGHSPVGKPQHSSFKVDVDLLEAEIVQALATE